jgi:hypothetical protein
MVVDIFTLSDVINARTRYITFMDEGIQSLIPRAFLLLGEDLIHCDMDFLGNFKCACTNQNLPFIHMHYSVSPCTEIPDLDDIFLVSSIHDLMRTLNTPMPTIVILTTDAYSGPYLEYIRSSLSSVIKSRCSKSLVFSNLPILEPSASIRISPL